MDEKLASFQHDILQLRAEAVKLNRHRYALRCKMEEADVSGIAIRRAIGFLHVEIEYASDYEQDMYLVWCILAEKLGYECYTVQQVDGALIRSKISPIELYSQLMKDADTDLTERFYDELTGIRLPKIEGES